MSDTPMREAELHEIIDKLDHSHIARKQYFKLIERLTIEKNERGALEKENAELKRQLNTAKNQVIDFCYFYKPTNKDFDLAKEQLAEHDKQVKIEAIKGFMDFYNDADSAYWDDCNPIGVKVVYDEYLEQLKG